VFSLLSVISTHVVGWSGIAVYSGQDNNLGPFGLYMGFAGCCLLSSRDTPADGGDLGILLPRSENMQPGCYRRLVVSDIQRAKGNSELVDYYSEFGPPTGDQARREVGRAREFPGRLVPGA
jgi:hypothetical protein